MTIFELLLTAIALSMDAFAVAICKGLSVGKIKPKHMLICGLWFGGFQALMPLIGYFLGAAFADYITSFDHWIAFVLLAFLGGRMIYEAVTEKDDEEAADGSLKIKELFMLAIATSIDALAVGITFAFLSVNIWSAVSIIGATTFILAFAGVIIGNKFGSRYKSKAEIAGGIILILIGTKILLEHLGIISF